MQRLLLEDPASVAVIRCNIGLHRVGHIIATGTGGAQRIPSESIPELNRHLRSRVVIVARRVEQG